MTDDPIGNFPTPASFPLPVCEARPDWLELHHLSWRIAASNIERPLKPGWKPQMGCMPGAGTIWMWDSCFISFFARYSNGCMPVINNLDNLYRMQRADGFIGMAYRIESETLAYGERINPPLLAWSELGYWKFSGDDRRLEDVVPRLVRFFDWIKANRRRKSGLYWFEDSGSTGMDNSPRSGYFAEHLDGSDICHVDLAAQQALAAECIATMARHLGDSSLGERFDQEHRDIVELLNRYHWDSKTGFYYDLFNRTTPAYRHNFLNHKTVAAFWPMMAGCCSEQQVEALLAHLLNPEEFWTRHPVASLSRDDPNFDPAGDYWAGGVWAPVNYMIAKALKRHGRFDLARRLAVAHLDAMSAVCQSTEYPGIWEAYAPDSFLPSTKKRLVTDLGGRSSLNAETVVRANFVGWSGLGPVAMLLEDVFGLDFDASLARITWNLQTTGPHGVERMRFNGGIVTLLTSGLPEARKNVSVTVTTDKAFTLALLLNGVPCREAFLAPGIHAFELGH